ncbi:sodium-dependent bicarbonate transport family permease [Salipaludibacillus neizhouensis]|uniref:Sodium-dependent bicarbonate transport family permease n=1 Tax=Salipaludibacillus neizhouensis TaxID=885475 RepID=A0A3A9KK89_9BACI|nr:sodium-dependent bicarbonate transport family permease [Salipaludibacillus neizhouensis]RKL68215.1 sodium-dependent bicarbonate transport family permease [Salipaludibacillus neizhouensis]
MLDIITQNLLSPVVLFFVLGIIASVFKSDLKFPKGLSETLSIYLLIAIGLKGGIELSNYSFDTVIQPIIGTLFLGITTPILTLIILRFTMKMDSANAIGLAATYGSVSIVTYGAAITFLGNQGTSYESFMNAMVVLMEIPAILVALCVYGAIKNAKQQPFVLHQKVGIVATAPSAFVNKEVLKESLFSKSVLLLVGSLSIGLVVGKDSLPVIQPLFIDLYNSFLLLFLLNMGIMAGERLDLIKEHDFKLVVFGICVPLIFGVLGILVGSATGLSLGGVTLMGVLAASASYIAAPAALKTSVPDANPSIYLGLALGITFPFNLIFGIPILFSIAQWIW